MEKVDDDDVRSSFANVRKHVSTATTSCSKKSSIVFYTPSADIVCSAEQRATTLRNDDDDDDDDDDDRLDRAKNVGCISLIGRCLYTGVESGLFYAMTTMVENVNRTNASYSGRSMIITCPVVRFSHRVFKSVFDMLKNRSGLFYDPMWSNYSNHLRRVLRIHDDEKIDKEAARNCYIKCFELATPFSTATTTTTNECKKHCCHSSLNGLMMDAPLMQNANTTPTWCETTSYSNDYRHDSGVNTDVRMLPCRFSFKSVYEGRQRLREYVKKCKNDFDLDIGCESSPSPSPSSSSSSSSVFVGSDSGIVAKTKSLDTLLIDGCCNESVLQPYGKIKLINDRDIFDDLLTSFDKHHRKSETDTNDDSRFKKWRLLANLYAIKKNYKERPNVPFKTNVLRINARDDDDDDDDERPRKKKKKKKPIASKNVRLLYVPNFSHVEVMMDDRLKNRSETFALKWGGTVKKTPMKKYIYNDTHNAYYTKKNIGPSYDRSTLETYIDRMNAMNDYLEECLTSNVRFSKSKFWKNHFKSGVSCYLTGIEESVKNTVETAPKQQQQQQQQDKEMVCSEMVSESLIRLGVFHHSNAFDEGVFEQNVSVLKASLSSEGEAVFDESDGSPKKDAFLNALRLLEGLENATSSARRRGGCLRVDGALNVYVDPARASPNDVWCGLELVEHVANCPHCCHWKKKYYPYLKKKTDTAFDFTSNNKELDDLFNIKTEPLTC